MTNTTFSSADPVTSDRWPVWAGRVLSGLATLFLLADGAVGLFAPALLDADLAATGFTPASLPVISAIAIACAVLYAVPAASVLGAILTTGFLGGAICTHFRIGEVGSPPQVICLLVGMAAWAGLYLRDRHVRALLPLRRATA